MFLKLDFQHERIVSYEKISSDVQTKVQRKEHHNPALQFTTSDHDSGIKNLDVLSVRPSELDVATLWLHESNQVV